MTHQEISIVSLNDLINSNRIFSVSDFQRHYEWETETATRFIEELIKAADAGECRFLGTICGYRSEGDQLSHFEVIDGQQRLTTLVLTAVASRVVAGDHQLYLDGVPLVHGYGTTPLPRIRFPHVPDADAAIAAICATPAGSPFTNPSKDRKDSTDTSTALWSNVKALRDLLHVRFDGRPAQLTKFWQHIFQSVRFTLLIEPTRAAAIRYFGEANRNVKNLKDSSLIKNAVISAADKLSRPAVAGAANTIYDAVVDSWGVIDEDDLHHVLQGLYGTANSSDVIRRSHMFSWVDQNRGRADIDIDNNPAAFAAKLASGSDVLVKFAAGRDTRGQANPYVQLMAKSRAKFNLPVIVAARHLEPDAAAVFYRRLAGYASLVRLAGLRGNDKDPFNLDLIETLRSVAADDAARVDEVFNEVCERLIRLHGSSIYLNLTNLQQTMKPDVVKPLLMLAASTCERSEEARDALVASFGTLDLEHVYPQSCAAKGEPWAGNCEHEPDAAPVTPDPQLVNALGNLTLLRAEKNKSAKDVSFADKRAYYSKEENVMLTLALGEERTRSGHTDAEWKAYEQTVALDPVTDWSSARIARRTLFIADRILQGCGISSELAASLATQHHTRDADEPAQRNNVVSSTQTDARPPSRQTADRITAERVYRRSRKVMVDASQPASR
jgi:hypothetical protein